MKSEKAQTSANSFYNSKAEHQFGFFYKLIVGEVNKLTYELEKGLIELSEISI
jgi:hypothetical protein